MNYDPAKAICNPGRLIVGPTNLAAAFPYGSGVPLGYVTKGKLVRTTEYSYADSEARGRSRVQTYRGMSGCALTFVLAQSMDSDVLNKVLPHDTTSAQGFSGANRLFLPQVGLTVGPGLVTPDSTLLFVSDDPNKPSLIIYSPSWHEDETQELDLVLDKPLEWALVVTVGLDSANRDLACDLLENLSL